MKRLLSLVLVLVMVLGLSVTAFAATTVETDLITDVEEEIRDGLAGGTDTGFKLIGDKVAVYGTDYYVFTNGEQDGKTVWHINILTSGWKIAGTASSAFAGKPISMQIENRNDVEDFTVTVGDLSKGTAYSLSFAANVALPNPTNGATVEFDTTASLDFDTLSLSGGETATLKIVGNGKEIDTPYLSAMGKVCLDNVTVKVESATQYAAMCSMGELSLTNGAKLIAISTADSFAYGLFGMGMSVSASEDSEIFLSGKNGAVYGFSATDFDFIEGLKASAEVVAYNNRSTMTAAATGAQVGLDFLSTIKDSSPVTVAKTVYNEAAPTGGEEPEEESKSGSTTITATKAEPFSYEIVIPTDVAEITAAGVYQVGQAKVKNVVSATDNTVISYTVTTTDFKCSGKSDLPATYYTEQAATNAFPTAVIAYENKADATSIPTMWVKIAENDWTNAAAGTYTATVTYNFSAEESKPVTAADALIIGAQFRVTGEYGEEHVVVGTYERTDSDKGYNLVSITEGGEDVSKYYCELQDDNCIYFADSESEDNVNFAISIYAKSNKYDPHVGSFISFEVKPKGETEFTAVELTQAETA